MEINNKYGKVIIENKAYKDIAQIATLKVKGVHPLKKENDFINCKVKDDAISLIINLKLDQNVDIEKVCSKIQNKVRESLEDMTDIKVNDINISIDGFINNDEKKR